MDYGEDVSEDAKFMFPGVPESLQLDLYYFSDWISEPSLTFIYITKVILVAGFLLNLFHLMVLTRKNMRKTATNVIMIGLSISDMVIMGVTLSDGIKHAFQPDIGNKCSPPAGYSDVCFDFIITVLSDFARRCSPWLVIFMAAVRAIAITKAMNRSYDVLQFSKFGWLTILISMAFSGLFAVFHSLSLKILVDVTNGDGGNWKPPKHCPGFSTNYSTTRYYLFQDNHMMGLYTKFNEIASKIIPCILFPILSAILIFELMKTRKLRNQPKKNSDGTKKKERTNALVICMTVFFMIAELPQGVFRLIPVYFSDSVGFITISYSLIDKWYTVAYLNAATHGVLCFFMSSQYRGEVRALFGLRRKDQTSTITSNMMSSISKAP